MSRPGPVGRRWLRSAYLWAVPAYVALALLATWPLVLHPRGVVVGDLESDVWKHLWGFWWVKQCLLERGVLPLYTHLLNYPYGGSLFFIDPLGALIALPLQLVFSAPVSYNLVILFNIVLAGVGAFALARWYCKNSAAAFVAGVIFACSPYLLANITSGISEAVNVGWMPLFLLYFARSLREQRTSNAVWAGIYLALATVGCWYYGVFCVMYGGLCLAWDLLGRWLARRRAPGPRLKRLRPVATPILLVVLAAGLRGMAVTAPETPSFWYWMGAAAFALSCLLLALRGLATGEAGGGRVRAVLSLVLSVNVIIFSTWILFRLLLRGDLLEVPALLLLAASSALSLALALLLLARRRPDRGEAAGVLAARWGGVLVVLCGATDLVIWTVRLAATRPGPQLVVERAWLGIAALAWLLVVYRMRALLGQRAVGDAFRAYLRDWRHNLWVLQLSGTASLVGLYLFAPPMPARQNALWWLIGTAAAVGLVYLRSTAATGLRVLRRRAREALQRSPLGEAAAPALAFYRTTFKRLLVMTLVGSALVAPFAYTFKRTLNSEISLVFRVRDVDNVDFRLSDHFHNISYLVDYVLPGKSEVDRTYTVDRLTRVSYVGWIALALAAAGIVTGWRRRRAVRWWLLAGVVSTLFSLGPFLYVTRDLYSRHRSPLYMGMYDYFPFFSQISIPYRFNAMAVLSLGVLAACALSVWMRHRPLRFQLLLAASVSLAVVVEVMLASPAPFPLPTASVAASPFCRRLAAEPGTFGVLDLPLQRFQGELLPGEYFYYQTLHGKCIPNRVEGEIPIYVRRNVFMSHLYDLEHDWPGYPTRSKAVLSRSLKELRDFRFKYFIVHENLMRPGAASRVHALLHYFLGPPERFPGNISLYRVYGRRASRVAGGLP